MVLQTQGDYELRLLGRRGDGERVLLEDERRRARSGRHTHRRRVTTPIANASSANHAAISGSSTRCMATIEIVAAHTGRRALTRLRMPTPRGSPMNTNSRCSRTRPAATSPTSRWLRTTHSMPNDDRPHEQHQYNRRQARGGVGEHPAGSYSAIAPSSHATSLPARTVLATPSGQRRGIRRATASSTTTPSTSSEARPSGSSQLPTSLS